MARLEGITVIFFKMRDSGGFQLKLIIIQEEACKAKNAVTSRSDSGKSYISTLSVQASNSALHPKFCPVFFFWKTNRIGAKCVNLRLVRQAEWSFEHLFFFLECCILLLFIVQAVQPFLSFTVARNHRCKRLKCSSLIWEHHLGLQLTEQTKLSQLKSRHKWPT